MLNLTMPTMPSVVEKIVTCVKGVAKTLWESAKALAKTTGVWVAVLTLCIGSFVLGHVEASHGKREIRDRMREAESRAAAITLERDMALTEVRRLQGLVDGKATPAAKPASPARRGKGVKIFPSGD